MSENELYIEFVKQFKCEEYTYDCESYDCCECDILQDAFEVYKKENGFTE